MVCYYNKSLNKTVTVIVYHVHEKKLGYYEKENTVS